MLAIDIKNGTAPSVDPQVNNPRLRNAFVNPKGDIQLLPNIVQEFELNNIRAIFKSTFNDRSIVVTQREVFYIQGEALIKVGEIISTTNAVRISENTQNQVTIVNGAGAWVFAQRTGGFSRLNATNNGFTLTNPVDVTVLNTITIIVGKDDDQWIISEPDNALFYDEDSIQTIDNSMGKLTGCEDLNNNLFIFGETGVQRWIPSIERTTTDAPFSQDPTYRDDYGCLSTGSLITDNNQLFYLSQNGEIRMMTPQGRSTVSTDGIEQIIANYTDASNSFGSYYFHKGFYLYQLSFPDEGNAFVYCPWSKKWSESDEIWLGFDGKVILFNGVYELTTSFEGNYKTVVIQSGYFRPEPQKMYERTILGSILLEATQGKGTNPIEQICFLQLSKDNIVYGNRVRRKLSKVGDRLFQFRWYMSYSNNGFSVRFTLELQQDITILNAWAIMATE